VINVNATNRLEHMETSIESAQRLLDHAQTVVTGLDAAHQRVERLAGLLRQAAIGLVIGGILLGALAIRHHPH
jgi:tetrahydromethanopterin S-methyltransferase subunit B